MERVERTIEVDVPVRTTCQWTQFETFPGAMEGVEGRGNPYGA